MASTIEAAGGVLWRPAGGRLDIELALIHRPGHDDWSLPKGKLKAGEPAVLGAIREVVEETGYRAAVGLPLGTTRYRKDGAPKRVRYWAMRAGPGRFVPGTEVDDLVWLPPDAARRLARGRDLRIIDAFSGRRAHHAWPLLLVRHGQAVRAGVWPGSDQDRPLDARGTRQATALARLLEAYDVRRMVAADLRRCRQTVRPLAAARHVAVESEPLFTKQELDPQVDGAVRRLIELARDGVPTVVCAQHSVLTSLASGLAAAFGNPGNIANGVAKGGFYVLHLHDEGPIRMPAAERVATSA